jgi:hypothetical protein
LHPKSKQVVKQFAGAFKVIRRKREREWVTLLLRRK